MKRYLCLIVAVYAIFGLAYSFVTMLGQGPDETAHFIYIRSLAEDLKCPEIAHTETCDINSAATHEGHQPPLYYAVMAVPYAALNAIGLEKAVIWHILRMLGVVMGCLWICASYRLACEIFNSRKKALLATAALALLPTSSYTSGVVNNDILIALLFTAVLIPILSMAKTRTMSWKDAVVCGIFMGMALLTKAQGLILVPLFLIAVILSGNKKLALPAFAALGSCLAVAAWWYIRCRLLYGTFMPQSLSNPTLTDGILSMLFMDPLINAIAIGSLTAASWGHFILPVWLVLPFIGNAMNYYIPLCIFTVALLFGGWHGIRANGFNRIPFIIACLVVVLTYLSYIRYVLVIDYMAANQGRLFLPVGLCITAAALVCVDGWIKKSKPIAARISTGRAIAVLAGLSICLNVFVVICTVLYYK